VSKQEFDDFLNTQIDNNQNESAIDWDKIRDKWLEQLALFYKDIGNFLADYEKAKKLSYQFSKKDIFEESIGSYSVQIMDIQLGKHKVRLEPIGTNIISADGRIDLIGANGKVKLVLVNKNFSAPSTIKVTLSTENEQGLDNQESDNTEKFELAWKIATPPPHIKYIDLNQDVFFDALLEVVGG